MKTRNSLKTNDGSYKLHIRSFIKRIIILLGKTVPANVGRSRTWIEKNRLTARKAVERNPELYRNRSKNWNKENAGKASQKQLRYYYRRKEQTPIGLSEDEQQELKRLYKKAQEETMKTGIQHHVDHIIPLSKGGLHLPSNIQVITALENFKKGTRLA